MLAPVPADEVAAALLPAQPADTSPATAASANPSVFMGLDCLRRADPAARATCCDPGGRRVTLHVPSPEVMPRKKLSTTIYITPEQNAQLKLLNEKTKVPVAEYIRQGIDLVLEKYKGQLPGQSSFDEL